MQEIDIQQLLHRYMKGVATPEEEQALREFLRKNRDDSQLVRLLEDEWENLQEADARFREYDVDASWRRIVQPAGPVVRRMHFIRRWGWVAAVLFILAAGAVFWMQRADRQDAVVAQITDIAPGSNKATLTLADGSVITLDSTGNQVIRQGNTAIRQHGGQLQYDVRGTNATISYNTLTTPNGGQFQLLLPDGTKVWLNAASSIRYPTVFAGQERRVEMTGEVYFEVAGNAQQPFRVSAAGKAEIEVLGTHFNVNSYENEAILRTTLIEGRVKVNGKQIKPGQQAQIAAGIRIVDHVDPDKVMAWKNGLFNFEGATLPEVMRQLERWYDIKVIYEGTVPDIEFMGELSRNISLNELLDILKRMQVGFRLEEGRRLIVINK
ncbi:FecR family protein [Chitinophaga cymbidii]|uniref:Iron dicitrate transporter FecR n=1 Tax=Chitinophaga cymbidii TaxID=1096750 RepID=A0A512RPI7_9BACT|nr:FecR family protein [Chitinophaga cymbidii]GEP97601.1 iron dicitrate transporter FecR [Chitinophaga cymbidii]